MKRALFAGACGLALLLGAAGTTSTHAANSFCRTDPTVTLSDGTQIVMSAEIGSDISYVQKVTYTLHIPTANGNTTTPTVTGIVYDQYGSLETVNVVADQTGNHYAVDTSVSDERNRASFTAYASINGSPTASATGLAGPDSVTITFTHG